ncbi:MAG: phosphate acyltransferase PlsX [Candidatus Omnitrophica bacterium]|nr:phosphate acyltransferase PlsX [Candidatus Omnitrophota bacterium]
MKIVLDAMGGDYAPSAVVKGAVDAVKAYPVSIILVGQSELVGKELKKYKPVPAGISIRDAREVVDMDEPAAASIRRKRDSSISVGIDLVKRGEADAFFSAGNTGAVVCAATLGLGMLEGIERPGIAIIMPSLKGRSLIMDVGANIDTKPVHILQYGIMGSAYVKNVLGKDNPRVGLLNIGEESTKGTDLMKESHKLLSESRLNFAGNVEAKQLFKGDCDVIVCDGFVGNVALKVSEAAAEAVSIFLKRNLLRNFIGKLGAFMLKGNLGKFRKEMDYAEYGGAPLLGVNGLVIIGHGRSSARAIKNAVRATIAELERKVNDKIIEGIREAKTIQ